MATVLRSPRKSVPVSLRCALAISCRTIAATVELTMAGVLPYVDGEVTFRFPLVVAPRYIPGTPLSGPSVGDGTAVDTDAVPDASRISPPVLLPGFPNPVRISFAVDLYDSGVSVEDVRVSLHVVTEESYLSDDVRRIVLQPGERLDRDFILRYRLGGAAVRTTLSLHPDPGSGEGGEGTFALTIVPPVLTQSEAERTFSCPCDVAFLLDRSGSMQRWKTGAPRPGRSRQLRRRVWCLPWQRPLNGLRVVASCTGCSRRGESASARLAAPRIDGFGLVSLGCWPVRDRGQGCIFNAPELRRASPPPPGDRSDIYSLGVILAQLLDAEIQVSCDDSGADAPGAPSRPRAPFWKAAGSRQKAGTSHSQVPVELETICARAIEPDRSVRYRSCAELIADLRRFLGVKPPGWLRRGGKKPTPP